MKKQAYTYVLYPLAIIALILILPLLKSRPAHNLDSMLFVKAAFFDKIDGGYEVHLYCTDAESESEHFFYGSAKDVAEAIKNAKNGSYKNMFFPSAEVLIFGGGIDKDGLYDIAKYAVQTNDFPLSVSVFKGEKELASAEYIKITDAANARNITNNTRLWQYANELSAENKMPVILNIRTGENGKIYFEGR